MPRFRLRAVLGLIALLSLAWPAEAAPAPIVFDFEDGLQDWEVHASAQRVQTQILGGEWAIFGDGFVSPPEAPAQRVVSSVSNVCTALCTEQL